MAPRLCFGAGQSAGKPGQVGQVTPTKFIPPGPGAPKQLLARVMEPNHIGFGGRQVIPRDVAPAEGEAGPQPDFFIGSLRGFRPDRHRG